jgi:putative pyruvate formate lyase activating enzyme
MISIQELKEREGRAREIMQACTICPRDCGVDRLRDEIGVCRIGERAVVHSFGPHFGEEPPLVGNKGSGTIFFSGCNLKCIFCQNFETSQLICGKTVSAVDLADMMLFLQSRGCHNINFVSPTHVVQQILEALIIARGKGLDIPLVFNCGGYESIDTLKLLDGIIDIYMPDLKYMDREAGRSLSRVADYPRVARDGLKEMHRQVGDLDLDDRGVARKGLLIRHLVLPGGLAGTKDAMRFISSCLSRDSYVNVMAQYRPVFRADKVKSINRYVSGEEVDQAMRIARDEGLWRGFEIGSE